MGVLCGRLFAPAQQPGWLQAAGLRLTLQKTGAFSETFSDQASS
jgi:hypothetical protein